MTRLAHLGDVLAWWAFSAFCVWRYWAEGPLARASFIAIGLFVTVAFLPWKLSEDGES